MTLVQNIKTFIKSHSIQGTKATWILFFLFAFVVFLKVMAFHWFVYHGILISSLWKNPSAFWMFWLPKISITLFLSVFTLVTKRRFWTILVLVLFDLWIIANIIYFRANNHILTYEAMTMAGNLQGVESSILLYWNWQTTFFIITTLVFSLCIPFLYPQRHQLGFLVVGSILIVGHLVNVCLNNRFAVQWSISMKIASYLPFHTHNQARWAPGTSSEYAQTHSIIAYFPTIIIDHILDSTSPMLITLSVEDKNKINSLCINKDIKQVTPQYNLLFVLVESLESFSLDAHDKYNNPYLPNFNTLIYQPNVINVNKVVSQAMHGVSADGQMIYNTGLLPIKNGAVSMMYESNTFPNYAHFYEHSFLSNPWLFKGWNQHLLTSAYGYKEHIYSNNGGFRDDSTFNLILPHIRSIGDSSFCYLAITLDSHSPFSRVPNNPNLQFDATMPQMMQDYLTCLHYTDSCFGVWYNEWKETEQARNTVLVITGDHTIFKDAMLQEFQPYAQQTGLSIASGKTYCPLIIQAPQITENIQITDVCYQMDVYPTIMHLIGCEDYYWKGFGVNLLDSTARHNRPITEEQAYQLSDKLIRADYFKDLQQIQD